jgi:hypothetical protein
MPNDEEIATTDMSQTLCDIHVGPIQGPWLRCAHCASSFDICRACETVVEHDPAHSRSSAYEIGEHVGG